MLINRCDYYPIGPLAALLPHAVIQELRGQNEGRRICSSERPNLNTIMGGKHSKSTIRRSVIVDDVSFDERIVVAEEERQHFFFVPNLRVEMNFHGPVSLSR